MTTQIWKQRVIKAGSILTALSLLFSSYFFGNPIKVSAAEIFNSGDVVINEAFVESYGGEFIIQNGVESVLVEGNIMVTLILDNVKIDQSGAVAVQSPIAVQGGAFVTVNLLGSSELKAGYNRHGSGFAGLQVASDSSLVIEGTGALYAYGGERTEADPGGAGIGGGAFDADTTVSDIRTASVNTTAGSIRINSGTVYAQGGVQAAGIGGGCNGAATAGGIMITGGTVTAQGGGWAAGIGDGDSVQNGTSQITNSDFYTDPYYIDITGGTVNAYGGKEASGIGATDRVQAGQYDIPSNSSLRINLEGGTITVQSGNRGPSDINSSGSAGIGAGIQTVMENNSISIGADVRIRAVSFGHFAISENYVDAEAIPTISIDPSTYLLLCRFPEYTDNTQDRTFVLSKKTESGVSEVLYRFQMPKEYRAFAVSVPGAGEYVLEGPYGDTSFTVEIEEGSGTNSGELIGGKYVPDALSERFTDIAFYKPGTEDSIVNASYQYDPATFTYDLYVPEGTKELDIFARWLPIDAQVNIAGNSYLVGTEQVSQLVMNVPLDADGETEIYLSKRDDGAGGQIFNMVSYKFIIHERREYALVIDPLGKVYDGKAVEPKIDMVSTPYDTTIITEYTKNEQNTVITKKEPETFDLYNTSFSLTHLQPGGWFGEEKKSSFTARTTVSYDGMLMRVEMVLSVDGTPKCRIVGNYDPDRGSSSLMVFDMDGQNHNKEYLIGGDEDYPLKVVIDGNETARLEYRIRSRLIQSEEKSLDLLDQINFAESEISSVTTGNRAEADRKAQNSTVYDPPVPFEHHVETVCEHTLEFYIRKSGTDTALSDTNASKVTAVLNVTETVDQQGTFHKGKISEIDTSQIPLAYRYYKINRTTGEEVLLSGPPKDAGDYRIEVMASTEAYDLFGKQEFQITRRPLTITGVENYRKIYDGSADAPVEQLGAIYFTNMVAGDDVRIKVSSAQYASPEVGAGSEYLILESAGIVGADANNYRPSWVGEVKVYGEIYYSNEGALFIKGQENPDPWRKYYPTTSTEYVESNAIDFEIKARTVGEGEEQGIYAFDISFGDMKFVFAYSAWNPNLHQYEKDSGDIAAEEGGWHGFDGVKNAITVTNRSNCEISFELKEKLDFIHEYIGLVGYYTRDSRPKPYAEADKITGPVTVAATKEGSSAPSEETFYFYFNEKAPQTGETDIYIPIANLTIEFGP